MHAIHIFNPETEFALAMGDAPYTAPKKVIGMRERLSFIQALIAAKGDAILSDATPGAAKAEEGMLARIARAKEISIIYPENLRRYLSDNPGYKIVPWGWNLNIAGKLRRLGVAESALPDHDRLMNLRQLAHRATAIPFLAHFPDSRDFSKDNVCSLDKAMELLKDCPNLCLKAPWSSSGRGILFTRDVPEVKVRQWIGGVISAQGSIIVEREHRRILDFGAEWHVAKDGEVRFEGYSALAVGDRGQYRYNVIASRKDFLNRIFPAATGSSGELTAELLRVREIQKMAIEETISGSGLSYSGPVGIDMFVTAERRINPCVEINLRTTMGMVALNVAKTLENNPDSEEARLMRELFPDGRLDLGNPRL